MKVCCITHGGVGAKQETRDGPQTAAEAGARILRDTGDALEAAVVASEFLEDDPRFNAGTGSRLCIDGKTIEFDGGSALMLVGRVGDSAHYGAGLCAGPAGAVATTGIGVEGPGQAANKSMPVGFAEASVDLKKICLSSGNRATIP